MIDLLSGEIAQIVGGTLQGLSDRRVNDIIIDSRHFNLDEQMAFVAIKGKNHDGHSFIRNLYRGGVRVFIVERCPLVKETYPDSAFIVTDDSVTALQKLAAYNRKLFLAPVIGVTGSAGKTIVKEWLANIFSSSLPVIRSPKSYNSQVGVPLSVLKLDDKFKLAIIEAGISMPGEMQRLTEIVEPEIGVITNIGEAHAENFIDIAQKAKEKLSLFRDSSLIVYCRDYDVIHRLIDGDERYRSKTIVDWSQTDRTAALFVKIDRRRVDSTIVLSFQGQEHNYIVPFSDFASVENAITVACVCLALNLDDEVIRRGLSSLTSIAMRMEIKDGINGCQLIEDYYNSDPGSFRIALESLNNNGKPKTLILSDFLQSGRDEKTLYEEVAELMIKSNVSKFIGIGPALTAHRACFEGIQTSQLFASTNEFIESFTPSSFSGEVILIKGARRFEFERVGLLLEQQVYQTILEVNLDAISNNLNEFRRVVKPSTRMMVMVKAFAYGAGASEIAEFLEYHGVNYLGVANVDEGVELRASGVSLPIIVMNPDVASFELLIENNLEPVIYSLESLEFFAKMSSKYGLVHYNIHVEIDTGMHRLGFLPKEIGKVSQRIGELEGVKVASVFSHFAASEDPSMDDFTKGQVALFESAVRQLESAVGYKFIRHICNSAAISRFPEYHFDMVRPGIGIYGAGSYDKLNLKTVGRFTTRVSQVKRIPANEPVGYNCRDVSADERVIAILPVGYADGLNRKLGNRKGEVFIKDRRVPIIGNVCMDACMIDVTGLDVVAGDHVEIFGENILIEELAEKIGTIPYEVLTSIPRRVKRVFYRE